MHLQTYGVFIVQPEWSDPFNADTPPGMSILYIPAFSTRTSLELITCLQMTDTGLFLNSDPKALMQDNDPDGEYFSYSSLSSIDFLTRCSQPVRLGSVLSQSTIVRIISIEGAIFD